MCQWWCNWSAGEFPAVSLCFTLQQEGVLRARELELLLVTRLRALLAAMADKMFENKLASMLDSQPKMVAKSKKIYNDQGSPASSKKKKRASARFSLAATLNRDDEASHKVSNRSKSAEQGAPLHVDRDALIQSCEEQRGRRTKVFGVDLHTLLLKEETRVVDLAHRRLTGEVSDAVREKERTERTGLSGQIPFIVYLTVEHIRRTGMRGV